MRMDRTWLAMVVAVVTTAVSLGVDSAWSQDLVPDVVERESRAEAEAAVRTPDAGGVEGEGPAVAEAVGLVGWLELSGELREGPPPVAWAQPHDGSSVGDVLAQLDHVARGERYKGMVIHLDQPLLDLSQVWAISNGIERVREADKKVLVFAEAYDLPGYLLASAADEILLQRKGGVELQGIAVEELYLAGLMEKVGVRADLIQVGKFKGAEEPMTRTGPSEAWSRNMDGLLDSLYGEVVTMLRDRRKLDEAGVEKLFRDSWVMSDEQLLKSGIVDALVDRDLIGATESAFGETFAWDASMGLGGTAVQTPTNPLAMLTQMFQPPQQATRRATLAVIHARGAIISGDSGYGDGLFSSDAIGSRTMLDALATAADDELVKGVVVWIDSPGGSALASEVVWQAMRELGETKPLYVVVGPMAASGGYYMACAADRIYVAPSSIVGSIGVVGGKVVMGDLYQKLGIGVERRSRGPVSDMFNSIEPFTPDQQKRLRQAMTRTYDQFLDRVRIGRGEHIKNVKSIAEGRLFTGRQAVDNGMADRLGTLQTALADLADEAKLEEGEYDVLNLPPPLTLGEYLESMFGVRSGLRAGVESGEVSGVVRVAREALGPRAWSAVSRQAQGLLLLREERALTLMPRVIVVK